MKENSNARSASVGLLLSGGLDSSILLGHLLATGRDVQPFYIQSHLHWQQAELAALQALLERLRSPRLAPLVKLTLPLADVYGEHWSVTGRAVPDGRSPDEAVFLPGRNALLLLKAAVWCQLHGIESLALATLSSNPFADNRPEFFEALEAAMQLGGTRMVQVERPLGRMSKRQVMELGRALPLELTFSCIDPRRGLHCGQCNKCAERRAAFALIAMDDPTSYVQASLFAETTTTR